MIGNNQDPLRFLKPRKKQFHLTPTKPNKQKPLQQIIPINTHQSDNSSIENSCNQSRQISFTEQNERKQPLMMNKQHSTYMINLINQSKQKQNVSTNNIMGGSKIYNPQKYYSSEVQKFLRKQRGLSQTDITKIQQVYAKQQNVFQNYNSMLTQSKPLAIIQRKSTQIEQTQSRFKQNRTIAQIGPKSVSSILIQTRHQRNRQKNIQNVSINTFTSKQKPIERPMEAKMQQHLNNRPKSSEDTDMDTQLKQCPTCSRKFNPNSYEKHVKVCQKVFYKKRKQFSSQKQRSVSSKKK